MCWGSKDKPDLNLLRRVVCTVMWYFLGVGWLFWSRHKKAPFWGLSLRG
jgi:hypothetical protein